MTLTAKSLKLREGRVGASEVAALLDRGHPFMTAGDIYVRLVHGVTRPSSPAMDMGNIIEETIHRRAKLDIPKARRNSLTLIHKTALLAATPDGFAPGAVMEYKNVGQWAAEDWDDGVPDYVEAQVQTQMLISKRPTAHVWALLAGSRFVHHEVAADPGQQDAIESAVQQFFEENVWPRKAPADTPDKFLFTITAPKGTVGASGGLQSVGDLIAESMDVADYHKKYTDGLRKRLEVLMVEAGADKVPADKWIAEAKTTPSTNIVSLRFRRRGKRQA